MTNPDTNYEHLYRAGDTELFRVQIRTLIEKNYDVERPSDHQLKIGGVNYYPSKGTITLDPCERYPKKGFAALLALLEERKGPYHHNAMTVGP